MTDRPIGILQALYFVFNIVFKISVYWYIYEFHHENLD
jgi:hypothetical protein